MTKINADNWGDFAQAVAAARADGLEVTIVYQGEGFNAIVHDGEEQDLVLEKQPEAETETKVEETTKEEEQA